MWFSKFLAQPLRKTSLEKHQFLISNNDGLKYILISWFLSQLVAIQIAREKTFVLTIFVRFFVDVPECKTLIMCNLFVGIAVGFENKTELSSKVQSILRQESVCKTVDEVPISILLMWQKICACIGCYVSCVWNLISLPPTIWVEFDLNPFTFSFQIPFDQ